ncbi:hypothetical protein C2G38_2067364 [Gigaspora rosea]|uniref:Uncharacterized protein n=1 Tax=Gigaspora rosea TaxID=44941 RepID=A0A397VSE7_9GLOM|nr:hypothetical protein C2G38_2067364 [Gigaspora rosea]
MTKDMVSINSNETSIMTLLSTVDNGYALVHGICNNAISDKILAVRCTLSANFISYNKTFENRVFTLYQLSQKNTSFNGIYCDIVSIGVGQICTISISYPSNVVNNTVINGTEYIRVNFLSSGSVLSATVISDLPNLTGVPKYGWRVKTMPFGGYMLDATNYNISDRLSYHYIYAYDEFNIRVILDSQGPFITNAFGVNALLNNNNTFLLASPYTNNQNTSWSMITIPLTKVLGYRDFGYDNLQIAQVIPSINSTVDLSTTTLSIVFYDPVMLSDDLTVGSITIYKTSNKNVRQKISPTMSDFCEVSPDGKTVNITVISSTFNQYGESYYVEMDNNFVKSYFYKEPLTGIHDGLWNLTSITDNSAYGSSDSSIIGLVGLKTEVIKKFLSLPKRSEYFKILLNEIANKVPVRRERLRTNEKFQVINFGQPNEQIIFSIHVNPSTSRNENSAQSVVSDLSTMIINKGITTFSTGIVDDLDQNYGFQVYNGFWNEHLTKIIVSFLILTLLAFLYIMSYGKINFFSKYLKIDEDNVKLIHAITGFALIAINLFFTGYFVFISSKNKPEFVLPSIIVFGIPLGINLIIATVILICVAWPLKEELKEMEKQISGGFNVEVTKIFKNKVNEALENLSKIAANACDKMQSSFKESTESLKKISNNIHEKINKEVHDICDILLKKISECFNIPEITNEIEFHEILDSIREKTSSDVDNLKENIFKKIITILQEETVIILMDELIDILLKKFFELLQEEILKKILDAMNAKNFDKPLKVVSNRMLERIFSKMKKEIGFKIRRIFKNYYKSKENSEKIQKVFEDVQPIFLELFDEVQEISDIIRKFLDEIQKIENLKKIIPKIFDQMKDKFYRNIEEISKKIIQKLIFDKENSYQSVKTPDKQDTNLEPISPASPVSPILPINDPNNSWNNNLDKPEDESNELLNICKDLLKKDETNHSMKSILILLIIVDSESLVILDNILEKYFAILDKRATEYIHFDNFSRNFKLFAQIRAFIEIFIKKIPLIIIMALYASSIVINDFISFMALVTSCLICLLCIIFIYFSYIKKEKKEGLINL